MTVGADCRAVEGAVEVAADRGGGGGPLTGTFTARLSAGGQTYTQTFNVREAPQRAR